MSSFPLGPNKELEKAESGIGSCPNFDKCKASTPCSLALSSIQPQDERRGSRDPVLLLVTEAPDEESSKGSAYSGSTSRRVMSIFHEEKYGIQLQESQPDTFEEFLIKNRIYTTSAVKCFAKECNIANVGNYVIDSCKEAYLTNQIESMENLKLIIPMGDVATSSILKRDTSQFKLSEIIGKMNTGIFTKEMWGNPKVVVFPHPSGLNRLSNPPILNAKNKPSIRKYKLNFRKALTHVREEMAQLGYNVPEESPDIWETPTGLSDFS